MQKRLLPPAAWMLAVIGIFLVHEFAPLFHVDPTLWRSLLGIALIVVGLGLAAWHKRLFRRVGTNVNTFDDPDLLVEDGLFQYIRNPMYLGFAVALAALAFLSGAASSWFFVIAFVLLVDRWYIPFEERAMRARFGAQYEAYSARTRRWI